MIRSAIRNAVVATAAVACAVLVAPGQADAGTMSPFMVGHRGGAAQYAENTMRAFDAGAAAGSWLESDVRFTKDDVPVMLHDPTVDRTTNGTGRVTDHTYAKLRTFKTRDRQSIPTFAQFAGYLKRTRTKAFIEFKAHPRNARQWAAFDRSAKRVRSLLVIFSKHPAYLKQARAHGYKTALYERRKGATPAQIKKQGDFYLRQYESVSKYEMTALARLKVRVVLFTPATARGWQRCKDLGAWGILTDNSAAYARWRD
jgi:glycerophosphoryl diester phosphodiesterase